MNIIRPLLIGFLLGGGIGAKLGAVTIPLLDVSFAPLYTGLMIGGIFGALIGLSIALAREEPETSESKRYIRKKELVLTSNSGK
ncbi:MAG: hypothetical protein ABJG78_09090 [Cyclobacteriaceae bacterium]